MMNEEAFFEDCRRADREEAKMRGLTLKELLDEYKVTVAWWTGSEEEK